MQADSRTAMKSCFGLDRQGMRHIGAEHWNLSMPVLYEHAVRRCEGEVVAGGSFSVNTGAFTGRTPRDKYIVEESGTEKTVWWGNINQPVSPARFDSLHQRMLAYFQRRELFVQDLYAGADPDYRLPVRVVTDSAWHSLFSRNMFIRPPIEELAGPLLGDGEARIGPVAHRLRRVDVELLIALQEVDLSLLFLVGEEVELLH